MSNGGHTRIGVQILCLLAVASGQWQPVPTVTAGQDQCWDDHFFDIQFIVDSSGSMQSNFNPVMTVISDSLLDILQIGPNKDRVGLVTYAGQYQITDNTLLGAINTKYDLKNLFTNAPFIGGGTYTGAAMNQAFDTFKARMRNDKTTKKICLVFTDGSSSDPSEIEIARKKWLDEGVLLFAIGLGSNIAQNGLTQISGDRLQTGMSPRFEDFPTFFPKILSQICQGLTGLSPPTLHCHTNFNVTIEAGNWSSIAVYGYGYASSQVSSEAMCFSQNPHGPLHFDVQDHCQGGRNPMKVANTTFSWMLRARALWLFETDQDSLFLMECEYKLTGEATWDSRPPIVYQLNTTDAPVTEENSLQIMGSTLHLVKAVANSAGTYEQLETVDVGDEVRFFIDSTKTLTHSDAPYIGVTGCKFYDRDPSTNNNLREFDLIGENGCNNPPSSYNPFKAAAATTDGMYFNENPDGADESGIAYSAKLKMFRIVGVQYLWANCKLTFCFEENDPQCQTPACGGPSGRRRRSVVATESPFFTENVVTKIEVTSIGPVTKIKVNGQDSFTIETVQQYALDTKFDTEFIAVLAVAICFALALLMIPVVYMIKRTTQRIYPDPQLVEASKVYPERPISVRHGEIRA